MGMFDDVEVPHDIENGPFAGDYQTKDLSNELATYVLQSGRLYVKLVKYEVVPEEERKHPVFGLLRAKFLGMQDTNHHGYIEMYNANETWKLKFTDGELVEAKMIEFVPNDPDTTEPNNDGKDSNGDSSYWEGDEQQYEYNPEDYEG
jgi:hypothetical protein